MQLIQDFFAKHKITETSIALGVSGGADSLALALMFKQEFPKYHLVALTVDHGLRPTSRQEAEYVANVMKKNKIEHHILTWEGEKPFTGIEEEARKVRYQLLFDWCKRNNFKYLAVAHHLYDQAETVLMRLQRGSGLYGLAAMRQVSKRDEIYILRPLLKTSPETLKQFLTGQKTEWVEDESNQDDTFLRVRLRKFLPILEKETGISVARLALAAENLDFARSLIEKMTETFIENHVCYWLEFGCSFDEAIFKKQPNEMKFYILSHLLCKFGKLPYPPEAESLTFLLQEMEKADFTSFTLGGCIIQKTDLKIWIIQESREVFQKSTLGNWDDYCKENPAVRGIKIPAKLREMLLSDNYSKKR